MVRFELDMTTVHQAESVKRYRYMPTFQLAFGVEPGSSGNESLMSGQTRKSPRLYTRIGRVQRLEVDVEDAMKS